MAGSGDLTVFMQRRHRQCEEKERMRAVAREMCQPEFELLISSLGSLLLMGLVELCRVFQKRKSKTGICSEQLQSDHSLYRVQRKPLFPAVLCGFPSFLSLTAQPVHTPTVTVAFCILQELIVPPHSRILLVLFTFQHLPNSLLHFTFVMPLSTVLKPSKMKFTCLYTLLHTLLQYMLYSFFYFISRTSM